MHALPYRDEDKILTLFTKEAGILKAVIYRAGGKKLTPGATDPLTRIEIILTEGRGDLFKGGDISILSHNLKLRDRLELLKAACSMAQMIQQSQLQHKPAPMLYKLIMSFFEQLPTFKNISTLLAAFTLKLLRHEGYLHAEPRCSICRSPLSNGFIAKGESLCSEHAPSTALPMTIDELKCIHELAHAQSYRLLENQIVSPSLSRKISDLFISCLSSEA